MVWMSLGAFPGLILQLAFFRVSQISKFIDREFFCFLGWVLQFAVRFRRSCRDCCLQCGNSMTGLRVRSLFLNSRISVMFELENQSSDCENFNIHNKKKEKESDDVSRCCLMFSLSLQLQCWIVFHH